MQKNIKQPKISKKKTKTQTSYIQKRSESTNIGRDSLDASPQTWDQSKSYQQRMQAADYLNSPHPQKYDFFASSKYTISSTTGSNLKCCFCQLQVGQIGTKV